MDRSVISKDRMRSFKSGTQNIGGEHIHTAACVSQVAPSVTLETNVLSRPRSRGSTVVVDLLRGRGAGLAPRLRSTVMSWLSWMSKANVGDQADDVVAAGRSIAVVLL